MGEEAGTQNLSDLPFASYQDGARCPQHCTSQISFPASSAVSPALSPAAPASFQQETDIQGKG